MKKVWLFERYGRTVIPGYTEVCFRGKKECQEFIHKMSLMYGEWQFCSPKSLLVFPKNSIVNGTVFIDRIDYGVDYDFDTNYIYNNITYSQVVYPNEEILKANSGLYKYTLEQIANKEDYINDGRHIYNKFTHTTMDAMAGHIDYKIYELKVISSMS